MKDDLVPILIKLPEQHDITIYPISDLHVGSREFMEKAWGLFVKKLLSEPYSYVILIGDLANNAITGSVSNSYEEIMRPADQKAWLVDHLRPIKDRILCGCDGNHEKRSARCVDYSMVQDIFEKLDLEDRYRANMCFLIIRMGERDKFNRQTYTMCVTHGTGGGMYISTSASKAEKFAMNIDGLDILVVGHTHRPLEFPAAKLMIDAKNKKVSKKQYRVIVATSWLEYGGYPVEKMLSPTAHCLQEIQLSISEKQVRVLS